jgi:pimeloyl-ACP methyl ester carboxylesterase
MASAGVNREARISVMMSTAAELLDGLARVLDLESDEDLVTPEQRAELRRCYPQASVHTFHGAGHTPWISHKEEYLSVIKEFLD